MATTSRLPVGQDCGKFLLAIMSARILVKSVKSWWGSASTNLQFAATKPVSQDWGKVVVGGGGGGGWHLFESSEAHACQPARKRVCGRFRRAQPPNAKKTQSPKPPQTLKRNPGRPQPRKRKKKKQSGGARQKQKQCEKEQDSCIFCILRASGGLCIFLFFWVSASRCGLRFLFACWGGRWTKDCVLLGISGGQQTKEGLHISCVLAGPAPTCARHDGFFRGAPIWQLGTGAAISMFSSVALAALHA